MLTANFGAAADPGVRARGCFRVTIPAAVRQQAPDESVKERVLAIVAEKTGYPKDMLDLDLDLEADLGVDTVKQAEMFAAIRELYNIPRDQNIKLRDYPTLAHVIRFVHEKRPDLAGRNFAANPRGRSLRTAAARRRNQLLPRRASAEAVTDESIKEKVLEIVAEKTGYPKEMLDLDLDLEADLGVDTVKQAEMFAAVRAAYNIPRDENIKLRDFPHWRMSSALLHDKRPDLAGVISSPPNPSGSRTRAAVNSARNSDATVNP